MYCGAYCASKVMSKQLVRKKVPGGCGVEVGDIRVKSNWLHRLNIAYCVLCTISKESEKGVRFNYT